MNTPEKKCCDKCLAKDGWMVGECFNGKCDCHKDTPETMESHGKFCGLLADWYEQVQKDNSGDGLDIRKSADAFSEMWEFIQDEISLAISSHNKELVEKIEKMEFEWSGTSEDIEKDKLLYKHEVLNLIKDSK